MYYQDTQFLIGAAMDPFILVPIGIAIATIVLLTIVWAVDAAIAPPNS
jgi:preprotein translocase subunit Sec61beta